MSGSAVGFEAFDPPETKAPEEPSVRKQADQAGYHEFEKSSDFENEGKFGTHHPINALSEQKRRYINTYCNPECSCLSKRYTIALLACVGFVISFGMRCNMSMARLHLIKDRNSTSSEWLSATQSVVDSSFFWGYLITQIPGGILASFFPANRIFGVAIFISSFLNLLVPNTISLSPGFYVMIIPLCKGLAEGVMLPACHGI